MFNFNPSAFYASPCVMNKHNKNEKSCIQHNYETLSKKCTEGSRNMHWSFNQKVVVQNRVRLLAVESRTDFAESQVAFTL